MNFWDKPVNRVVKPWEQPIAQAPQTDEVVLDEEAMAVLQEDPNVDIFEEEEDDLTSLMSDANLRLEQGRLYQMILQNDIFADTNADPRAIRAVQREVRKHAKERLETLLGIRQEQAKVENIVSSPFNDMEVVALKMVASKVTKGATESTPTTSSGSVASPSTPKKDGINPISGNLHANTTTPAKPATPLSNKPKTPVKPQQPKTQAAVPKSAINNDGSALQKPIEEMTPQELAAHNTAAEQRTKANKSAIPNNLVPHPTPDQLYQMYAGMAATGLPVKLVPQSF